MKSCKDCKYAEWDRTKTGRLSPSGNGRCIYPYKVPKLPASMYWISFSTPHPCGGNINRKEELKEDCIYFNRK